MELTPRTGPETTPVAARRRRNPVVYGVLLAVALGLGFVIWQGLTNASLYFYNADEAVEMRDELAGKRFRLQGTVLGGTIEEDGDDVAFTVAYGGVRVDVRHQGSPPELFQPGIPVVLEGRWSEAGDWFESDEIQVKHSADYEADHGDRLEEAETRGTADDEP